MTFGPLPPLHGPFVRGPRVILLTVSPALVDRLRVSSRNAPVGWRSLPATTRLGLGLVALATLLRAWALWGSWFYFDDLAFLSAGMNDPLDWHFVTRVYAGHLMPAGWVVIKLLASWAPYRWAPWAAVLLALQVVASLGMLRLLRSMFGDTRAVLALLTGYLFLIFTVPAGVWFAAGINQLPLQIALVFGLHAHLEYLRTHSRRALALTLGWTVFGLLFYEKAALLFGIYALVTLCWFASGTVGQRLASVWNGYRYGVVAHGCVAVPYFLVYAVYGLDFGSGQPAGSLIAAVAYRLVGVALSTGIIGGPFEWRAISANSLAAPSDLICLISWVAVGSLIYYAARTRTMSRRAWSLVLFTSAANVYLLSSARATLVGPDIGLEYRYQTEAAILVVLSVGLALLPLRGALEVNAVRTGVDRSNEREPLIRLVMVAVAIGAVVSTLAYVHNWQDANGTKAYYTNVRSGLASGEKTPVPLVDLTVPQNMLWAFGYPENTYSHIFANLAPLTRYPDYSVDRLYLFDDAGRLSPVVIVPQRAMAPAQGCGYILQRHQPTTIPLNGPVVGGGWWIQMGYAAPRDFTVAVHLGDRVRKMRLPAGMHQVYFEASGSYSSLTLDNDRRGATACVSQLVLGRPSPGAPVAGTETG